MGPNGSKFYVFPQKSYIHSVPASVRALELQVISVQMASGEVLSYEYEFDDGSPKILASEPSISHIFHLSKVHTITVHATDLSKKRVTAVTTSNVSYEVEVFIWLQKNVC